MEQVHLINIEIRSLMGSLIRDRLMSWSALGSAAAHHETAPIKRMRSFHWFQSDSVPAGH